MGANEKHDAVMQGHTPSELALITAWVDQRRNLLECHGEPFEGVVERTSQAQRTIEKIRAEAKAEALNDAVNGLDAIDPGGDSVYWDGTYYQRVSDWLRLRAEQIRGQS